MENGTVGAGLALGPVTGGLPEHRFELPKDVSPGDQRVLPAPIDQWLYFFRRAVESAAEELIVGQKTP